MVVSDPMLNEIVYFIYLLMSSSLFLVFFSHFFNQLLFLSSFFILEVGESVEILDIFLLHFKTVSVESIVKG